MRKIILAAAAAALLYAPATYAAPACAPIASVAAELVKGGVGPHDVTVVKDVDFIKAYNDALGVKMPKDANVIGAIFFVTGPYIMTGLVENKEAPCIRYFMRVPSARAKAAMMNAAGV